MKSIWEWFTRWMPWTKPKANSLLDAFEDASDDVAEFVRDIKEAINDEKKQLLVELNVGKDTKMRPLKAAVEQAVVEMLAKQYPECDDVKVKFFYHR